MLGVDIGPLGHPALIARYMRAPEDGIPSQFEPVHLIGMSSHCASAP